MDLSQLAEGQPAPAFTLPDANANPVSLSDFAGQWVVLYFYPKDDTPGCTTEACEFSSSATDFEGLGAVVLGVSPDTPESHRKFVAKHRLDLRLLSDPEHKTIENYGAWGVKKLYGKESLGVIRSTVLIDPIGRIARVWPKVKAEGHAATVCEALRSRQSFLPRLTARAE